MHHRRRVLGNSRSCQAQKKAQQAIYLDCHLLAVFGYNDSIKMAAQNAMRKRLAAGSWRT